MDEKTRDKITVDNLREQLRRIEEYLAKYKHENMRIQMTSHADAIKQTIHYFTGE